MLLLGYLLIDVRAFCTIAEVVKNLHCGVNIWGGGGKHTSLCVIHWVDVIAQSLGICFVFGCDVTFFSFIFVIKISTQSNTPVFVSTALEGGK